MRETLTIAWEHLLLTFDATTKEPSDADTRRAARPSELRPARAYRGVHGGEQSRLVGGNLPLRTEGTPLTARQPVRRSGSQPELTPSEFTTPEFTTPEQNRPSPRSLRYRLRRQRYSARASVEPWTSA